MSKTLLVFILSFVYLAPSAYSAPRYGGVGDGGGNFIILEEGQAPVLLDLFIHTPDLKDRYENSTGRQLVVREGNWIQVSEQAAYPLAIERLQAWEKTAPMIIKLIRTSLNSMRFWLVQDISFQPGRFWLPPKFEESHPRFRLQPAASYAKAVGGAQLNSIAYAHAGEFSQAGLLIHEALRHIQIVEEMKFITDQNLTDKAIQDLTAKIMLTEPRENSVLVEQSEAGLTLGAVLQDESNSAFMKNLCQSMKSTLEIRKIEMQKLNDHVCSQDDQFSLKEAAWFFIRDSFDRLRISQKTIHQHEDLEKLRDRLRNIYLQTLANQLSESDLLIESVRFEISNIFQSKNKE